MPSGTEAVGCVSHGNNDACREGATSAVSDEESEEDSCDTDEEHVPELVDELCRCQSLCDELLQNDVIAVDIEGVNLGRHGEICIVQVAVRSGRIFLFDVTSMGTDAFSHGLKSLIECEKVAKLFYDCRSDGDAMFHLHGIMPKNVLDLQVLSVKANSVDSKYLPGMMKALESILPYAERQKIKGIKLVGGAMFAPNRGGSFDVWKRRPLPEVLRKYCAHDVVHLFSMLDRWQHCLSISDLRTLSEKRMTQRIERSSVDGGAQFSLVDFSFPSAGCTDEPPSKRPRTSDEMGSQLGDGLPRDGVAITKAV